MTDLTQTVTLSKAEHARLVAAAARARPVAPTPVPRHGTIHDAVIADLRADQARGEARYGSKHYLRNGLDGLWEAYEEAIDMACWLRQEIEERKLGGQP